MKSIWVRSMLGGYLAANAVNSLRQDMYGVERYVKLIQDYWIDAAYTVPLASLLLIIAISLTITAGLDESKLH